MTQPPAFRDNFVHGTQYRGDTRGHYESFFLRANHPARPLAFWIRHTIFSPAGRPADALGELWAVFFDGERHQHVVVKREVPLATCRFSPTQLHVEVAAAQLDPGRAHGAIETGGHALAWDLSFAGGQPPVYLLPARLYRTALPRAKSLVAMPMAVFRGSLLVDGERTEVSDWVGSQNHNWGRQHTDRYAWGQVAGFDSHPDSFLEVASARYKIGPWWTPFLTPLVLRHGGTELALNGLRHTLRAHATLRYFEWRFAAQTPDVRIAGTITAPRESFVGLRYANPPGGVKQCLNSKLARCELHLMRDPGHSHPRSEQLVTSQRAAFEILTDDDTHGVTLAV